MSKHRTHRAHSIAFKRQVVQEYLAGETLHGVARRHDLSRTLIRIWVDKYEAGAFDEDAEAADTIQEHEARIAALERLVQPAWSSLSCDGVRAGAAPASSPVDAAGLSHVVTPRTSPRTSASAGKGVSGPSG